MLRVLVFQTAVTRRGVGTFRIARTHQARLTGFAIISGRRVLLHRQRNPIFCQRLFGVGANDTFASVRTHHEVGDSVQTGVVRHLLGVSKFRGNITNIGFAATRGYTTVKFLFRHRGNV